jgi:hypothetical protein
MKQYKVVVLNDSFIGGRFNPEKVQMAANREAAAGWRLVEAVTNTVTPLVIANKEELLLFFEKDFVDQPVPENPDAWTCPQCKCDVNQGQRICHNCGEPLEW